ncbi:MAG: Oxidoreductase molybdopterin binding domain protein [Methanocella sp. PtaU1.Bin125]|nr:MAG: Oxidoreductase molybdopterin binding domain protein [Methanocella sp. PtaU1.Bin125]
MRFLKAPAMIVIFAVLLTALAISGCTTPTPTAAPTPVPTATPTPTPAPASGATLSITGKVNTPLTLSVSDLNGYAQHFALWQNEQGTQSYRGTGAFVLDLLNAAGMQGDAVNVTFACTDPADKYSSTVTLADLNAKYSGNIVAFNWSGVDKQGAPVTNANNNLRLIAPAGGGKNQVGNIDTITVS